MAIDQTLLLTFFGSYGEHLLTGQSCSNEAEYINHYAEVNGTEELIEIARFIDDHMLGSTMSEAELSGYVNNELHCPFNFLLDYTSVREWLTHVVDTIRRIAVA